MAYFLLTGATGLLGRYLLRDLTLADVPLAVIVRATKRESAEQRIETAMARWEETLQRSLLRPVVLTGDISEPGLGLSEQDQAWVAANCDAVIHSAASLTFIADDAAGEPWLSNIHGTRHVLNLCEQAGIRKCHYVSTAYVCGRRRGVILEDQLDQSQGPSNDYELSKFTAEQDVRASSAFDQVTVYRPSIIVGDSQTGFTTSFHGFYTPLRLIHSLVSTVSLESIWAGNWLGELELSGDEHKNLVPVEWVSEAMTRLITDPRLHGQTYHLTNPAPATVALMCEAIGAGLSECVLNAPAPRNALPIEDLANSFRDQMRVYESYWSDDPQFDSSRTQSALPDLPCPVVDLAVMQRLVRFAIDTNFGWPRELPVKAEYQVRQQIAGWLSPRSADAQTDISPRCVNLRVSGQGGGQYHLLVGRSQLIGAARGLGPGPGPTCDLNTSTFAALVRGDLSLEASINSGRLVITGNSVRPSEIARCFRELSARQPNAAAVEVRTS